MLSRCPGRGGVVGGGEMRGAACGGGGGVHDTPRPLVQSPRFDGFEKLSMVARCSKCGPQRTTPRRNCVASRPWATLAHEDTQAALVAGFLGVVVAASSLFCFSMLTGSTVTVLAALAVCYSAQLPAALGVTIRSIFHREFPMESGGPKIL